MKSLVLLALAALPISAAAATCEGLKAFSLPSATVTLAERVDAGHLDLPSDVEPLKESHLPAFCRVAATLRLRPDSEIRIEVWLPEPKAWNGKLEASGNGGWGGSINYPDMSTALIRGYAAVSTDTGHTGGRATFAMGHPEKLIDFGYRAIHEMTVAAKQIVAAYYGNAPKLSYFAGCSSGGRQALMEAQRYPDDYDGIVAGAPTNNWTKMMFGRIWVAQATLADKASYIPPSQYPLIHRAALNACDALDGVKDGLIENPAVCRFDPAVLQCKGEAGADCLSEPQVAAARRIYTPATNPRTHEEIFPPMMPGSELNWKTLAGGPEPIQLASDYFRYAVYGNPAWDFTKLSFDTEVTKAIDKDNGVLNAVNPDLRPFFRHGGKLIQYHGWSDRQVMPLNSIRYYKQVAGTVGAGEAAGAYRLFMAPGMDHCGGGEGPNTFDMLGALDRWRDGGLAPDSVPAAHLTDGKQDRTRPLCAYPSVAQYKGTGSIDAMENFSCVTR